MKIQEQDRFHGAALTQIVDHASFKALNRASAKYGHYLVNADVHVFVKYRKSNASPWLFTVQPDELRALASEVAAGRRPFLALVCGYTTVCALDVEEIRAVVDLSDTKAESIRVEVPKGGSCHVSGSAGKLKRAIAHNSFPDKLFA